MFKWNARKIQNLTGLEIWLFILARVLIGFGLGILYAIFIRAAAERVAGAAIIIGLILFLLAARGLVRRSPHK